MKYIIILLTILTSLSSFGRETFPGVEYSYVKIFLLNIGGDDKVRPDSHIYKNGEFADSKIGDGVLVSESSVQSLNTLLSGDINTLLVGLSKCFVPRHGLIYYDKNNNPVASVSICFECEQIKLWSSKELRNKIDFDKLSEKSVKKAEKQIVLLKQIIKENGTPVFNKTADYIQHVSENESYSHLGETTITYSDTVNILDDSLSLYSINHWFVADDVARLSELRKSTAGGRKYKFLKLVYDESTFMFDSNDEKAILGEAMIVNSGIWLPNNVAIGMSLDNVMGSFLMYDGIAFPEIIRLKNKHQEVVYWFEKRTLKKINIYVYQ